MPTGPRRGRPSSARWAPRSSGPTTASWRSGASLVAANRYLGDEAAIDRSWAVFRGLTGDRSAYAGFQDMSADIWACPGVPFTPANSGCPGDPVRYGAFVKDVTRGSDPPTPD